MGARVLISAIIAIMVITESTGNPTTFNQHAKNLELEELTELVEKKTLDFLSFFAELLSEFARTGDAKVKEALVHTSFMINKLFLSLFINTDFLF